MSSKRGVSLAVSTLLVLAVLTAGGRAAEPQKQAGEPFIKIREVTLGDPHPVHGSWIPHFTDTTYEKMGMKGV